MTQITNDEERHVLILDDDRDFADSLAGVLRLEKYRVTVVYRYADVVAAIAKDPPHVALIDLRLDTKNGIEVVRLLHAEQPEILAVIITAYASIETTIAAMKAGAYDYLRKPVHSSEILAALDRCFERRRLAAERREALAQLARSEGRLRRLIEHSPSAISFEDENGTSLILNDRFRQLFPPGNENSALTAASDDAIIRAGGTVSREIILGSSQYARNLLVTRFPVFGEGERPIGIGTIATDVTETRQAEERLRQAQRLEALGRLTGGVAHDFNNLLAVVLGNLRLLEDELRNQPDLLEMVQEGIEATLNGSELTSRLLAIGQSQQLKPEVTDINEVLRGVVRMLDRVLGESIEIQLDLSPQLWNVRIDRGQLEGCLLNLAINSRDAMPAGGTLILSACNKIIPEDVVYSGTTGPVPGSYIELTVRDTGVGMSPEILEKALQPFFTTKPSGHGSGLGLSIVHGFVAQSGGHLEIASVLNEGTAVTLRFPRCEEAVDRSVSAWPAPKMPLAKGEHVLVVEDQQQLRRWLSRQLRRFGYSVEEASGSAAALRYLAGPARIDLVLTDIVLPGGINGIEICRAARSRVPAPALVLMSGHAASMLQEIGSDLPEAPVLRKPIEPSTLSRTLRAALDQRSATKT